MKRPNDIPSMGAPPKSATPKIDVSALSDIVCKNPGCGNYTFVEVMLLKRVPAFMTDNGKEGLVPIPAFACNVCGFVNEEFIPSFMKNQANGKIAVEKEAKTPIEIVR